MNNVIDNLALVFWQLRNERKRLVEVFVESLNRGTILEGVFSRNHLVEGHPQTIDVGARRDSFAACLFWGDIIERTNDTIRAGMLIFHINQVFSDAEIR